MSENAQHNAEQRAVKNIRKHNDASAEAVAQLLLAGNRTALSQAITWVESTSDKHSTSASEILRLCLPHSGSSIRIGITGVPGVGKSTFIDVFGEHLIQQGKKVAVLAIDPSSRVSGGSILGDKTRMEKLSQNESAFIRPSPSANTLGGVTKKTRESIVLCEAAGFDIIIIETVGVGQSETAVHGMTDFFLLLMLAGAGDQLQGIKRGIMEMCDAMLITKADGDNEMKATRASTEYMSALHLFPPTDTGWIPPVQTSSALQEKGIAETWQIIMQYERWMKERNFFIAKREKQDEQWLMDSIQEQLRDNFFSDENNRIRIEKAKQQIHSKELTPSEAALWVLNKS